MPEHIPGYDDWKLDNGPYENDGEPECFKCTDFRKPPPKYEGWCKRRKAPTGDIDRCLDFVPIANEEPTDDRA